MNSPTVIKLLLKYYNYSPDNNIINTISTNNDINKTSSNSNIAGNQNYRYSTNSIISDKNNVPKSKMINKDNNRPITIKDSINSINYNNELTQDYLIHFQTDISYNNLENNYPPKIINIKSCVFLYLVEKQKLNITLDSLLLFKYAHGKYHLLNDEESFYPNGNTKLNNNQKDNNNISNSTTIYYNINKEKIKILVELYSKSVDHISLNISKMCSLLMLKYIIMAKLKEIEKVKNINYIMDKNFDRENYTINKITINDLEKKIKIYGNGIVNNNFKEYISKKETNRTFNNSSLLYEIYSYYINNMDTPILVDNNKTQIEDISINKEDLNDGVLSFIMMEQKEKKCSLGLDFRFTILQFFMPVPEEINKEEKDDVVTFKTYIKNDSYFFKLGLNLYFNCLNKECKYYTKCFILNVGYGNYDIFNLVKYNAFCPACYKNKQNFFEEKNKKDKIIDSNNNNLVLKYIGMINAKWAYKGYLIGIKMTVVEGKGMTVMKDILYKTKEFDYLNQFRKLIFQIERYNSKNKYDPIYTKNESSFCSEDYNIKYENDKMNNRINKDIDISNLKKIKEEEPKIEKISNEIKNEEIVDSKIEENIQINTNLKVKEISNNNKYENDNLITQEKKINNIDNNIKIENNNDLNQLKNDTKNNNIINYDYKFASKKFYLKNINLNRKNNSKVITYYGNTRQIIQNPDGNETNNTNVDFNIIIDKAKSSCCDNCFDYQQTSQVCVIY